MTCKSGQYYDEEDKKCKQCPELCKEWNSRKECTSCINMLSPKEGNCTTCMEYHKDCAENCTDTECKQCFIYFLPLVNGKCTWRNLPFFSFELIGFGEFSLNGLAFKFRIYISVKTGILFNAKIKITNKNEKRFLQEEKVPISTQDGITAETT